MSTLPDRFLSVLRPPSNTAGHRGDCRCRACRPRPPMDNAEFGEALLRMIRAWEIRVIADPAMLVQNEVIVQRCREVTNVAIAANAERYAADPRRGASMAECARLLGITKPSASARRARGVAIMGDRIDRAGAVRFAEARREREALAAARLYADAHLDDYRTRSAS